MLVQVKAASSRHVLLFRNNIRCYLPRWSFSQKCGTPAVRLTMRQSHRLYETHSKFTPMAMCAYLFWFVFPCLEMGSCWFYQQHDPGEDQWGYEHASERWSPVHTVTTIVSDHRLIHRDEDWRLMLFSWWVWSRSFLVTLRTATALPMLTRRRTSERIFKVRVSPIMCAPLLENGL